MNTIESFVHDLELYSAEQATNEDILPDAANLDGCFASV